LISIFPVRLSKEIVFVAVLYLVIILSSTLPEAEESKSIVDHLNTIAVGDVPAVPSHLRAAIFVIL
jgi:hypothetical protein